MDVCIYNFIICTSNKLQGVHIWSLMVLWFAITMTSPSLFQTIDIPIVGKCKKKGYDSKISHLMDNSKVCLNAGSHGVPSPIHVKQSHHGGKVPTFEPQEPIKVWDLWAFVMYWLLYAKILWLVLRLVRSNFLLGPTLSTSLEPHLKECCHVDIHVIRGTEDLGPVWRGKSQLPCSQWLRFHRLTKGVWNVGLGTMCEPALTFN